MKSREGTGLVLFHAGGQGVRRAGLQLVVFLAVEAFAELCRRHLCVSLRLPAPWSPGLVAAISVLVWSFEAHDRWTFRHGRAARLGRVAPFVAIGLAGLIALELVARVSIAAVAVAWPAVLALKFLAVRSVVWRPGTTGRTVVS